jgi:hypothetical protein
MVILKLVAEMALISRRHVCAPFLMDAKKKLETTNVEIARVFRGTYWKPEAKSLFALS